MSRSPVTKAIMSVVRAGARFSSATNAVPKEDMAELKILLREME